MTGQMTPTVLLYSVPSDVHREIAGICLSLGLECKKIARARFNQSLGCHAGLPTAVQTGNRYEGEDFPSPMLVFAGFSDAVLDRFLLACRRSEMPEILYRAVVTKHNVGWSARELYEELVRERESITAGTTLQPVMTGDRAVKF